MKTKTVNVYTYSELSEASKDKVKQWYNSDIQDLTETLTYDLHEIYAFPHAELSYSLSNCQGDGVSFIGTWEDEEFHAILIDAYNGSIPEDVHSLLSQLTLDITRCDSRYCHEHTVSIELIDSQDDENNLGIIAEAEQIIDEYRICICKQLEDTGYTEIEDRNSDDFMIDACEANDYEFYENGELA